MGRFLSQFVSICYAPKRKENLIWERNLFGLDVISQFPEFDARRLFEQKFTYRFANEVEVELCKFPNFL